MDSAYSMIVFVILYACAFLVYPTNFCLVLRNGTDADL